MTDREIAGPLAHLRPIHLLTALALYFVGAGLARYLGARINGAFLLLELAWIISLLTGFFLLGDYFEIPFQTPIFPLRRDESLAKVETRASKPELLLYSAVALLSTAAVLTVLAVIRGALSLAGYGLMGGLFFLMAAQTLPGLNLDASGFGEFAVSISLVIFPPALAFFTHYGGFHRYLTLAVFPLFPLHFALILTLRLRSYARDLRRQRKTLLVRIGWLRGVFLHNLLVLSGFVLFGAALLFGLPVRIVGTVFLALIPAGFLIWYYAGLERGVPVRWPLIVMLSLVIFFLPVYLLVFSAWIY